MKQPAAILVLPVLYTVSVPVLVNTSIPVSSIILQHEKNIIKHDRIFLRPFMFFF